MMTIITILFSLILALYSAAASNNLSLFSMVFIAFVVCLFVFVARIVINIVVLVFSEKYRRIARSVIIAAVFFVYSGIVLNVYFFPKKYSVVSLVGDAALLVFTVFLSWSIAVGFRKRILHILTVSFLFCGFLFLWLTYGSGMFANVVISRTEELKSLPYAVWVPAEGNIARSGVTKYNQDKACPGLNVYASSNLPNAFLMDMEGKVLHSWSVKINKGDAWYVVQPDKSGNIFIVARLDNLFLYLDWDSAIKWKKEMIAHHDIAIADNEDVYVLSWKDKLVFVRGLPLPIMEDYVLVFSPSGELKKEISVYNIFKKDIPFSSVLQGYFCMFKYALNPATVMDLFNPHKTMNKRLDVLRRIRVDVFHDNRIQIINRDINGLCKKGDLLLSLRNMNLIAIVDPEKEKLIWKWGSGNIDMQHYPSLLDNGNILVFDNGPHRGYSRILEINPLTGKIIWQYKTNPPQDFFSPYEGSCQRLPNGNTLICESGKGRVFEVTKDGEMVWEFYNPEIDKIDKKRAGIYKFIRFFDYQPYKKNIGVGSEKE